MEVPETVNTSDGKCNSDDFPLEDLWPNFNAMVTKLQEKYFGAPGEKFVAKHHGFDRDFWAGASNSPTTVLYRVHMKPRTAMSDPCHCATSVAGNKKVKEAEAANAAASEAAAAVESAEAKQKTEAAAATGTSEAKEAKDKDEEILALIQERRTIKKDERERIREVSRKTKKCIREKKEDCKARKNPKDLGRTQRDEEHFECQIGKEANSHPEGQTRERRNHYVKRRNCTCVRRVPRKNCMKTTKAKITKKGKKAESRTEKQKKRCLLNSSQSQNSRQARFKMPSTASKEEKQETVVECELNSSKNCCDRTKQKIRHIFNEILRQ